jgi:hypothetical protein
MTVENESRYSLDKNRQVEYQPGRRDLDSGLHKNSGRPFRFSQSEYSFILQMFADGLIGKYYPALHVSALLRIEVPTVLDYGKE